MTSKKYYVVLKGRKTGIFDSWSECQKQIDGFSSASYKSYKSLADAKHAFYENNNTDKKPTQNSKKAREAKKSSLSESEIIKMKLDVKIFSDGACKGNPGKAGTGLAIYKKNSLAELWYGLFTPLGTNNTAELNGIYAALRYAKKTLVDNLSVGIFCDSQYAIDCITKWALGWEQREWRKKNGDKISNPEIIAKAFHLYKEIAGKIDIYHVNGHVGIKGNELADRMSTLAIKEQKKALTALSFNHQDIDKLLMQKS